MANSKVKLEIWIPVIVLILGGCGFLIKHLLVDLPAKPGSIVGTISNASPGIRVRLDNQKEITATNEGFFRFDKIEPGKHLITYKLKGFQEREHSVVVKGGKENNVDLREPPSLVTSKTRKPIGEKQRTQVPSKKPLFPTKLEKINTILSKIDTMSENELLNQLGQLFIIGLPERSEQIREVEISKDLVKEFNIGGFIYYPKNLVQKVHRINSQEKLNKITNNLISSISFLKEEGMKHHGVEPFIAVDHEGGTASHLSGLGIATEIPAPMALATLRDSTIITQASTILATELALLGFSMNFAPVVDININQENDLIRDRSFGGHKDLVIPLAVAFHESQEAVGIIPVSKHFPGHGSTKEGFHTPGLPKSLHSIKSLKLTLEPFRKIIKCGAKSIMTSHLSLQQFSAEPITFNKKIVTELLRGKGKDSNSDIEIGEFTFNPLGFKGVIMTDDLGAASITKLGCIINYNIFGNYILDTHSFMPYS